MAHPLSIVFLDPHAWDYHADTPFRRPLGGTQSAACHLAIALAARGHRVALSTHTTEPGTRRGVECVGREPGRDARWLGGFDFVVVLGTGSAEQLRSAFPLSTRLLLWTGFTPQLRVMQHLGSEMEHAGWDGFVFASLWQMRRFRETHRLPAEKSRVLRYGAASGFHELPERRSLPPAAPTFLHTSSPERGLSVLLDAWPAIRDGLPGACLIVTSGRQTYQIAEADDEHRPLYDRARAMAGVDYVGPLSQPALAELAGRCDALLYPCIFGETGCVAAIEALAAGLRVIATDMGVLPETCAGHAALVRSDSDHAVLAGRFGAAVISDWRRALAEPQAFLAQRVAQQRFTRAVHGWNRLAGVWEGWLRDLLSATMSHAGAAMRSVAS